MERFGGIRIGDMVLTMAGRREHMIGQMGQQLPPPGSKEGEKAWLWMLIDTMENSSRPEFRGVACDHLVLAAVTAQLLRPASSCARHGSHFSLRN